MWSQSDGTTARIYSNYSNDGGKTWIGDQLIDYRPRFSQIRPEVAISGSNVIAVWGELDSGLIYFNNSSDYGRNWVRAQILHNEGTRFLSSPKVVISESNAVVIWLDWSYSIGEWKLYSNYSGDGGKTWGMAQVFKDLGSDTMPADFFQVAIFGSNAVVICNQYDKEARRSDIYANFSFDGGKSWEPDQLIEDCQYDGGSPQIAISDSHVVAVWHQTVGSTLRIYSNYGLYKLGVDYVKRNTLNMAEMPWHENTAPYYSTGAATCQMILDYIREGAEQPTVTQDEIYEYAKGPQPFGPELNADEVDKALGHFDPYDSLVSNWADSYDSLPDGNPFQGYNYTVDTYDPASGPDAMNEYMRDICHWMAYTVTQEDWWESEVALVARPTTPAAVPIGGTYDHWVAVKGYATSENPCPQPRTNPWYIPDFTVYGFWMKDPLIAGLGQDTYKIASECASNYFMPLTTNDSYDGLLLQIAEPPAGRPPQGMRSATINIPQPTQDPANLEFIGVKAKTEESSNDHLVMAMSLSSMMNVTQAEASLIKKKGWKDLVDSHLLTDPEAVAAFEATKMRRPILVNRLNKEGSDYYLVPFAKKVRKRRRGRYLTSAVVILDAKDGYFKEASWTGKPERFLKVNKNKAIKLLKRYILQERRKELRRISKRLKRLRRIYARRKRRIPRRIYVRLIRRYARQRQVILRKYAKLLRYVNNAKAQLVWEPNSYSDSPYSPYWKIDINGYLWYVTQEKKIIQEDELAVILDEIRKNILLMRKLR